ncbi:MAG: hypothetical protein CMJ25_03055 [Phycisphaerae bacterium]|nr:hypothetical protein [Phycisphaerae bacterium]|tara:strand:- start:1379 stop:3112 length:1734 start_codon:yes stop_codon:yes gene_type:complete
MSKHLTRQLKKLRGFRLGRVNVRKEARSQSRLRNNLEKTGFKRITSLMLKFGRKQAKDISVNGTFNRQLASREFQQELRPVLTAHYRRIYQSIYEQNESRYGNSIKGLEANVFGINQDIEDLVLLHVRSRESLITNISERTSKDIDNILTEGREYGLTPKQMGEFINKEFPSIGRRRANTIARTETHNAASTANHQYHQTLGDQLGIGLNKRWVATSDGRTRSIHSAANGQTVAMDEDFIVGGAPMKHAGDPRGGARNNVNCRCVIVYVDDPDAVVDDSPAQVKPLSDTTIGGVQVSESGLLLNKTTHNDTLSKLAAGVTVNKIRKNLRKQVDENYKHEQWDKIGHDQHRFKTAERIKQYGEVTIEASPSYIRKNRLKQEDVTAVFSVVEDTLPELNALSQSFGLPPLRGISTTGRQKASASMGDGVLGFSTVHSTRWYNRRGQTSNWKQGQAKNMKPRNTIEYFSNGTDRIKAMIYHEFGHHVHQMHKVRTKARYAGTKYFYDDGWKMKDAPDVEKEMKKTKGRKSQRSNAPSVYGEKNSHEWFAENFSAWQMGLNDVVDPDFFPLIEKIKKESSL